MSEIYGYEDITINEMDEIYFGSDYSSDDMSDADSDFEPFLWFLHLYFVQFII